MYRFGVIVMITGSFFLLFSFFQKNNKEKKAIIGTVVTVVGPIIATI